jgi:hypothetical protein
MVWAAIRKELYTNKHITMNSGKEIVCGERRAHGRYKELRENFDLINGMEDLALNERRILKWILNK